MGLDESVKLLALGSADIEEFLSIEGVDDGNSFLVSDSLAIEDIGNSVRTGPTESIGIDSSPLGERGKGISCLLEYPNHSKIDNKLGLANI